MRDLEVSTGQKVRSSLFKNVQGNSLGCRVGLSGSVLIPYVGFVVRNLM